MSVAKLAMAELQDGYQFALQSLEEARRIRDGFGFIIDGLEGSLADGHVCEHEAMMYLNHYAQYCQLVSRLERDTLPNFEKSMAELVALAAQRKEL